MDRQEIKQLIALGAEIAKQRGIRQCRDAAFIWEDGKPVAACTLGYLALALGYDTDLQGLTVYTFLTEKGVDTETMEQIVHLNDRKELDALEVAKRL